MTSPTARFLAWLDGLPAAERAALDRRYAELAIAGGAVVRRPDGTIVPIPPLLTPEVTTRGERDLLERDAHGLLRALVRLTRYLMSDAGRGERERLFRAFSPLEARGLAANWRAAELIATARVDYLIDVDGRHRALEVNATIPAMQGYTDVVAEAFLQALAEARGLGAAAGRRLLDRNGRNTDDLLASLLDHYRRLRGPGASPSTIAIVHRPGDAQLGELLHYQARFTALGHPTVLATPEQIAFDGAGRLTVLGQPHDLFYRHIFARRLDPGCDFARALLAPEDHAILNPIASHLEVKGMLGHLSLAGAPEGAALAERLGLDDEELGAIRRALPWTRVLTAAPARGPGGEAIADLVATVAAEGDRFVLKRSWDYGGKSVFLGAHHDDDAAARAAVALEVEGAVSWPELVAAAAADRRDEWVVQELIRFAPRRHYIAGGLGWRDLYVDRSAYSCLGVGARPSGGAARAAPGKIVNILGGGGLAPLLLDEVVAELGLPEAHA